MIAPDFESHGRTLSNKKGALVISGPANSTALLIDTRLSLSNLAGLGPALDKVDALCLGVKCDLRNLMLLQYFPSLRWLNIGRQGKLTSLTGLGHAPQLEHLLVHGPAGLDLQDIHGLSSLAELLLDVGKNLEGLELSRLSSLEQLAVVQAEFRDLEFLTRLPKLRRLRLSACSVKNWDGLRNKHGLVELGLAHCQSPTLDFVAACKSLHDLDLSACHRATDLSFIQSLTALQELNLNEKGRLDNFQFLRSLVSLRRLRVVGIRPEKVSAADFDNLRSLRELQIGKWADPYLDDIKKRLPKNCSVEYFRM